MASHASLSDPNIHEPKGASTASVNTSYIANGSGSGSWRKIKSTDIDTTSIPAVNRETFSGVLADVSAPSSILIPIPVSCIVNTIQFTLGSVITVADSNITVTNPAAGVLGTQVITQAGSAEGTTFVLTVSANNTLTAPSYIKVSTDGGSSTTAPCYISVVATGT